MLANTITKSMGLLSLVVFATGSAATPTSQHVCKIEVTDVLGAAIAHANITIYGGALSSPTMVQTQTDLHGTAQEEIVDGFYDVCVMSMAFDPQCRKIRVIRKDRTERFRLKVSPLVVKEIGDKFQ